VFQDPERTVSVKTTSEYTCEMCKFTETKITVRSYLEDRDDDSQPGSPVFNRSLTAPWGCLEWEEKTGEDEKDAAKWLELDLCPGCLARVLAFIRDV
jgi:hypothetical protein